MEAILVLIGALVGATASIGGGLVATRYQYRLGRRQRRETREEQAIHELIELALALENVLHRCWFLAQDGGQRTGMRTLGQRLTACVDEFRSAWNERLGIDIESEPVRMAAETMEDAVMIASFDDPQVYLPEVHYLAWADAAAFHLRSVTLAYLRGRAHDLGPPPSLDRGAECPHLARRKSLTA